MTLLSLDSHLISFLFLLSFLLPQEILLKWPCCVFTQFKNCSPHDIPFSKSPTLVEMLLLNYTLLS